MERKMIKRLSNILMYLGMITTFISIVFLKDIISLIFIILGLLLILFNTHISIFLNKLIEKRKDAM